MHTIGLAYFLQEGRPFFYRYLYITAAWKINVVQYFF